MRLNNKTIENINNAYSGLIDLGVTNGLNDTIIVKTTGNYAPSQNLTI